MDWRLEILWYLFCGIVGIGLGNLAFHAEKRYKAWRTARAEMALEHHKRWTTGVGDTLPSRQPWVEWNRLEGAWNDFDSWPRYLEHIEVTEIGSAAKRFELGLRPGAVRFEPAWPSIATDREFSPGGAPLKEIEMQASGTSYHYEDGFQVHIPTRLGVDI